MTSAATNRPLRIVYLALGWPPAHPAGSEVMGHELCKALVRAGHDVTVSLSRPDYADTAYELDGVHVLPFESIDQDGARTKRADVIIGHLIDGSRAAAFSVKHRVPSVVVSHNWEHIPAYAALAVYNSEWLADYHGRERPHIVVRPHVAIDDYVTTPGEHVTLINSSPAKGALLVEALAAAMPDTSFLMVEGAYGEQIHPDLPNVTWQPMLPPGDMRDQVYARTRILLMPSLFESWGRTAVEAMASGIPVIANPTMGLVECVDTGGTLVDVNDAKAWKTAITRLQAPKAWQAASRKATARARELHDITVTDLDTFVHAVENLARGAAR